jgi:hypothetical protein
MKSMKNHSCPPSREAQALAPRAFTIPRQQGEGIITKISNILGERYRGEKLS